MENSVAVAILQLMGKFEATTLATIIILMILSPFGVICMVVFFWMSMEKKRNAEVVRMDSLLEAMRTAAEDYQKANADLIRIYREDTKRILEAYGRDIHDVAGYYKTNVELVVSWKRIAEGFQETVVLNTATMQRMCDMMQTNQFCPNARLPK